MNKIALCTAAFAALTGAASAQIVITQRDVGSLTVIGGWDFNSVGTATSTNTLVARYNQQYSPYFASTLNANGNAALTSTLYFTNSTVGATFASNRNFNVANAPVYDLGTDGLTASNDSLGDITTGNVRSVLLSNNTTLDNARAVFMVNTITDLNEFGGVSVAYSARNQGGDTATISWSYSLDGGSTFNPIAGTTAVIAANQASFSVYTADFSAVTALNGVAGLLIGLEYSENSAAASVFLDNVAIYATATSAIPEPSSFAALAGLCGLGFAAGRRRRRA